jgi:hypothetical protein
LGFQPRPKSDLFCSLEEDEGWLEKILGLAGVVVLVGVISFLRLYSFEGSVEPKTGISMLGVEAVWICASAIGGSVAAAKKHTASNDAVKRLKKAIFKLPNRDLDKSFIIIAHIIQRSVIVPENSVFIKVNRSKQIQLLTRV